MRCSGSSSCCSDHWPLLLLDAPARHFATSVIACGRRGVLAASFVCHQRACTPAVSAALQGSRGAEQSIDPNLETLFEGAFGTQLSEVSHPEAVFQEATNVQCSSIPMEKEYETIWHSHRPSGNRGKVVLWVLELVCCKTCAALLWQW